MNDLATMKLGDTTDAAIAMLSENTLEIRRDGKSVRLLPAEWRALGTLIAKFDPARCRSHCSFLGRAGAHCQLRAGHAGQHRDDQYEWSDAQGDRDPQCASFRPGSGGQRCELDAGHPGEHRLGFRQWIGNGPGVRTGPANPNARIRETAVVPAGTAVARVGYAQPVDGLDAAEELLRRATANLADAAASEDYKQTERLTVDLSEAILNARMAYAALGFASRQLRDRISPLESREFGGE